MLRMLTFSFRHDVSECVCVVRGMEKQKKKKEKEKKARAEVFYWCSIVSMLVALVRRCSTRFDELPRRCTGLVRGTTKSFFFCSTAHTHSSDSCADTEHKKILCHSAYSGWIERVLFDQVSFPILARLRA